MKFYLLLGAITLLYGSFAAVIWARTKNLAFPLGLGLLYYWTCYGAWFIVADQLRGHSYLRYEYFFAKLFPLFLDDSYILTIAYYGIFLLSVEGALLLTVRRGPSVFSDWTPCISNLALIATGAVTGFASFWIIRNSVSAASEMNISSYAFVRADESAAGAYKIHELLMRVALFCACTGLAVIASGRNPKAVFAMPSKTALLGYVVLLAGLLYINFRLGQRREVASALIAAGLLYLVNVRKVNWALIAGGTALLVIVMGLISMTRGGPLSTRGTANTIAAAVLENVVSNEPFAAHLSLYGSIARKVPVTYGSSLVYLAASLVPGVKRPPDIYEYYADRVKAVEGQGFTVHHATGWYLNFGVPGIIVGGGLIGLIWGALYSGFQIRNSVRSHAGRVFFIFVPWLFTAALPSLCRTGPEGYKGILFEVALIPTAVAFLATMRPVMSDGALNLAPAAALVAEPAR